MVNGSTNRLYKKASKRSKILKNGTRLTVDQYVLLFKGLRVSAVISDTFVLQCYNFMYLLYLSAVIINYNRIT